MRLDDIRNHSWQAAVEGGRVRLNKSYVIDGRGGSGQVYPNSAVFLGSTGDGTRPQAGHELQTMWFEVPKGDNQTWLFEANHKWWILSARWEDDGKLRIKSDTDLPLTLGQHHIEAWVNRKLYVTNTVGREPGNYRVCDPIDLLQCLEGRITPHTLAVRSKKLMIEDPRDVRIRELQEQLADRTAKITDLETSLAQRESQIESLEGDNQTLRDDRSDLKQHYEAALADRAFWESAARNMFRLLYKLTSNFAGKLMITWKASEDELMKFEKDLTNSGRFDDQIRDMNKKKRF